MILRASTWNTWKSSTTKAAKYLSQILCVGSGMLTLLATSDPTHAAGACQSRPLRVAIDVGHMPAAPGAQGASGKFEYYFNLRFARELETLAKSAPSLDLYILDPKAVTPGLLQRTQRAARSNADLFVSVHHDSVNDKYIVSSTVDGKLIHATNAFRGYSIFVSSDNRQFQQSRTLAELIGQKFKAAGQYQTLHHAEPIAGENRKLLNWELGVYDAPFAVLRAATMPAVLVEVGVISNRSDEQLLEIAEYRTTIERALLDALQAYCSS